MPQAKSESVSTHPKSLKRKVMVMARAPQKGRVKTRLAREVGEEKALGAYVAMLRDSLLLASAAARVVQGKAVLAFTPRDSLDWTPSMEEPSLRALWGGAFWPQPEGNLGEKMNAALRWAFEENASTEVLLMGTDSPHLNATEIGNDLARLSDGPPSTLILPPAQDGGFVRLCARALPPREMLQEVDWSQHDTRALVEGNARRLGWSVTPDENSSLDIDDVDSLRAVWRTELQNQPSLAPHLHFWVRENMGEEL